MLVFSKSLCDDRASMRMIPKPLIEFTSLLIALFLLGTAPGFSTDFSKFPELLAKIKQSIVGIGTFDPVGVPPYNLLGTGFAVRDGLTIVTCAHVVPIPGDVPKNGFLAVFSGVGPKAEVRRTNLSRIDDEHDVAILKIGGDPLPVLTVGRSGPVREGETLAFTGFPIGQILGLFPVTHRGMVSALTPIVQPAMRGRQLNSTVIRQLRAPFNVIQLDGTAYPGNSGGPLYDMSSGEVVGIVNMVFVKERKEYALTAPSGISFAIPALYIEQLLASGARLD